MKGLTNSKKGKYLIILQKKKDQINHEGILLKEINDVK